MSPNVLLRLATLLKLHGETVRLFSDTHKGGNGKTSRITALAMQIETISAELTTIAEQFGASEVPDASE